MSKYRILCVDDSKSVHAFLRQCLEPLAKEIDSAFNGAEAVEKLRANIAAYDFIMLDWEMPVMDGPSTFEEFRKLGLKTPVFMLTSKNEPTEIIQMIEAGVTEYILKPFTQDILLEKLNMNGFAP